MGLIIFLVYIGGLMVMFAYFLCICPNQMIRFGRKDRYALVGGGTVGSMFVLGGELEVPIRSVERMSLGALYRGARFSLLMLVVAVLLITLVAVVKVVDVKRGPLRPFTLRAKRERGCGLVIFYEPQTNWYYIFYPRYLGGLGWDVYEGVDSYGVGGSRVFFRRAGV